MSEITVFWIVIIINFLVAFICWFISALILKTNPEYRITRFIVMIAFPVTGPLCLLLEYIIRYLFLHRQADLSKVIFLKDKRRAAVKAEEEEKDIVPPADLNITDTKNGRRLMLRILRSRSYETLGDIMIALGSDDSEIAHYAASCLQAELGKFRLKTQNVIGETEALEKELEEAEKDDEPITLKKPEEEEKSDREKLKEKTEKEKRKENSKREGRLAKKGKENIRASLIKRLEAHAKTVHEQLKDMHLILEQNVLSDFENTRLAEQIDYLALFLEKREYLSASETARTAKAHLTVNDEEKCERWRDALINRYPDSLEAYSVSLKLFYAQNRREEFFDTLEALKRSGIPLDNETIEIIRAFA